MIEGTQRLTTDKIKNKSIPLMLLPYNDRVEAVGLKNSNYA